MRKSRFSDEKIVAVLKEADNTSVAAAARNHRVSDPTIYSWRKHFAGIRRGVICIHQFSVGRFQADGDFNGAAGVVTALNTKGLFDLS